MEDKYLFLFFGFLASIGVIPILGKEALDAGTERQRLETTKEIIKSNPELSKEDILEILEATNQENRE